MRRSLRLSAALVSAACGLCFAQVSARAEAANERDPCAVVTRTVLAQIETIKHLKRHPDTSLQDFPRTQGKKHGKHDYPEGNAGYDGTRQVAPSNRERQEVLARERRQAEALNGMLPGFGCAALDIDAELTKPENPDLLEKSEKTRKPH